MKFNYAILTSQLYFHKCFGLVLRRVCIWQVNVKTFAPLPDFRFYFISKLISNEAENRSNDDAINTWSNAKNKKLNMRMSWKRAVKMPKKCLLRLHLTSPAGFLFAGMARSSVFALFFRTNFIIEKRSRHAAWPVISGFNTQQKTETICYRAAMKNSWAQSNVNRDELCFDLLKVNPKHSGLEAVSGAAFCRLSARGSFI